MIEMEPFMQDLTPLFIYICIYVHDHMQSTDQGSLHYFLFRLNQAFLQPRSRPQLPLAAAKLRLTGWRTATMWRLVIRKFFLTLRKKKLI